MLKLIVSDLDDTLIHKDEHLSNEVVEMVRLLQKRGIGFTFATGRMPYRTLNYAEDISLKLPFVANNGSILFQDRVMVFCEKLSTQPLRETIQTYMEQDPEFTVLFSYEDRERPLRATHWIREREYKYPGYNEPLGYEDGVWDQEVHKIYVVDEGRSGRIGRLAQTLKARPALASCFQYGEFSMEIVAPDTSKATGVQRLIQYMGYDQREVMAIGDHTNDIEVLRLAGIGVAVANAVPELRDAADYVSPYQREKGVLDAINKYIIREGL